MTNRTEPTSAAASPPHGVRAPQGSDDHAGRTGVFEHARPRAGIPAGLHVMEREPARGWTGYEGPVVVFVHGSLDRGASFARTARRLPEWGLVAYDRRGYQRSRDADPAGSLLKHVEDLCDIARAYACSGGRLSAVGHSVGGTIVLGAACCAPELFASAAAYEPSMPWLGFHPSRRSPPGPDGSFDAGEEAERFFRRVVGKAAWERLSEGQRAERRADGPALVRDLRGIREGVPFDVTKLVVPTVVAAGGPSSMPHHRQTADWIAEHVPAVRRVTIAEAGHGAHFTSPDAFADLVRSAVALGDTAA